MVLPSPSLSTGCCMALVGRRLGHCAGTRQRECMGADDYDEVDLQRQTHQNDDAENNEATNECHDSHDDTDNHDDGAHPHPHHDHRAVLLVDTEDENDAEDSLDKVNGHLDPALAVAIDSLKDPIDGSKDGQDQVDDTNGHGATPKGAATAAHAHHTFLFGHLV